MKQHLNAALVALTLALSAPAHADKASNSLNIALAGGVNTLDNYRETDRPGLMLARLVYDSLLNKDPETGQFRPELASSYKVVSDRVIDFEIRRGVKFHDGTTMTADDVVYTLNLVSSPAYNARFQIAVDWIEKVDRTGEHSVRLTMKRPFAPALEMLAGNLPIYPKNYYTKAGSEGMAVKPVGTGPYKAVEVLPGTRIRFERFADYFAGSPKGRPSIEKIDVRIVPEASTQYAELSTGQVDWIWRFPADAADKLKRLPGVAVRDAQIFRFEYLALNPAHDGGKSPLADPRVRKAFGMALNRDPIRQAFYGPSSQLLKAACSPKQFGCAQDLPVPAFDPKGARALLAQAGYPNGIQLDAVALVGTPAVYAAMAAGFKEAGITLKITPAPVAAGFSDWRAGKIAVFFSTFGSYGIGDVALSTSQFFSGNADDLYKDPRIMPLLKEADASADRTLRQRNYREAQRLIGEQNYWVPLWTYTINFAHHKDLDVQVNADEFVPFYNARWK